MDHRKLGRMSLPRLLIAGLLLFAQACSSLAAAGAPVPKSTPLAGTPQSAARETGPDVYRRAEKLLADRRFNEVEKIARNYREGRTKVVGGNSALVYLYAGLSAPNVSDEVAGVVPASRKRALLEEWLVKRPHSLTARIALASYWIDRAWGARGAGYSAEVTDEQFAGFRAGLTTATKYLAKTDPASDPKVYYLLIEIAMGASRSRAELDTLYERAITAHPDFFHYYSQRANTVSEKWYGGPGDVEQLARSVLAKPGGETGLIAYSYIAAMLSECNCNDVFHKLGLSWKEVKAGYEARRAKYDLRNRDWNKLCLLAATAGAPADAKEALDQVGTDWDPTVWNTRANFEGARHWIEDWTQHNSHSTGPGTAAKGK
jgi:hypothetical protein